MTDYDSLDIFTDETLVEDPYPYFEHLRSKCPVAPMPHHAGTFAVTGYDEAMRIYREPETFSSISAATGPFMPLGAAPDRAGGRWADRGAARTDSTAGRRDAGSDHDGSAATHHRACGADAAAHAEASARERGVHVASRRTPTSTRSSLPATASSSAASRGRSRTSSSLICWVCPRRCTTCSVAASSSPRRCREMSVDLDRVRLRISPTRAGLSSSASGSPPSWRNAVVIRRAMF